jgi:hypothetical protein
LGQGGDGLIESADRCLRDRRWPEGGNLDGHRILSRASVETMLTRHQLPAGASPERSATGEDDVRHGSACSSSMTTAASTTSTWAAAPAGPR